MLSAVVRNNIQSNSERGNFLCCSTYLFAWMQINILINKYSFNSRRFQQTQPELELHRSESTALTSLHLIDLIAYHWSHCILFVWSCGQWHHYTLLTSLHLIDLIMAWFCCTICWYLSKAEYSMYPLTYNYICTLNQSNNQQNIQSFSQSICMFWIYQMVITWYQSGHYLDPVTTRKEDNWNKSQGSRKIFCRYQGTYKLHLKRSFLTVLGKSNLK